MSSILLRNTVLLLALALFSHVLTGCGQKGDLYLPPEQDKKSERN